MVFLSRVLNVGKRVSYIRTYLLALSTYRVGSEVHVNDYGNPTDVTKFSMKRVN